MNMQLESRDDGRDDRVRHWITELGNKNGMIRRQARKALERAGLVSTPYLIEKLRHADADVRWEATKALGQIADPRAATALVFALMDKSFEVQWLAAEALIAIGEAAIRPLLEGLIQFHNSIYMRQGAHHVLHAFERRELLTPSVQRVLDDLRSSQSIEPYPISARRALKEPALFRTGGDEAPGQKHLH